MDLFSAYELYEEFTLHDVSYLLLEHLPLRPGSIPRNDPHEVIRHRAFKLGEQLINYAIAGKLRATKRDIGHSWELSGAPAWIVTRNDLKDWAKRKMIRPTFLFPQLPPLDTIRNVATADAYRVGTQSQIFTLEYRRALLRIAQQINNGQVVAYVPDSDGEFARLQGDDALVFLMRNFLVRGGKSDQCFPAAPEGQPIAEGTAAGNIISTNMDWTERLYIPTEVALTAESLKDPKKVSSIKPGLGKAKQDSGVGRDILTPLIEKTVRDVGSEEFSAVFPRLRELALNGQAPFTGAVEGDALCYTNSENKLDRLTINALQKRLQRRRSDRGQ